MAEFALFGLPSVLIPLPTAADDHQRLNAEEFVAMGAATWIPQSEAQPAHVARHLQDWIEDPVKRSRAAEAMRDWDVPDATERLVGFVEEAASKR